MSESRPVDLELIFSQCAAITSSIEFDDVVARTLGAMKAVLPGAQCEIALADGENLRLIAAWPPVSEKAESATFPIDGSLVGLAARHRTPIYSLNVHRDPRVNPEFARWAAEDRSFLAVPLAAGSELIGTIHAVSPQVDAFSDSDAVILLSLAPAVAAAIRNALVLRKERESWAEARELDAQKSSFMKSLSADLGGPMAEMKSICDKLSSSSDTKVPELAEQVLEQARAMSVMVEEALTIIAP